MSYLQRQGKQHKLGGKNHTVYCWGPPASDWSLRGQVLQGEPRCLRLGSKGKCLCLSSGLPLNQL